MILDKEALKGERGDKMQDTRENKNQEKPLIIYLDDDGEVTKTYSNYEFVNGGAAISFITQQNKITIPVSRLVKIKEGKE